MNPLVLLALGFLLWPRRRQNPTRRRRRNVDFFTDSHGHIRPIRDTSGYDPEVDEIERENRERRDRAERYSDVKIERLSHLTGGVDRPPWGVGFTSGQLERIARDHGVRATSENWWEAAGLTKGSGELRLLLREGGYRLEKTRKGAHDRGPQRTNKPSKYAVKRTRSGALEDLPF